MKYDRTSVSRSQYFDAIMEKYKTYGSAMSIRAFYRDFVEKIDRGITYRQWAFFEKKLRQDITENREKSLQKIAKDSANVSVLEENANLKIMQIANFTIDEIMDDPDLLKTIPVKSRMDWLFKAMRARDSRMQVMLKKRGDDRKQTVFETLMEGAQFGAIAADEVPTPTQVEIQKVIPQKVEFKPEAL